MGLGNVLFGRKKLSGAKLDKLFALPSAAVTMEAELGLRTDGVAAVVFKPLSAGDFMRAEQEIDELLGVAARDSGSEVRRREDSFGFQWLVVRDKDLEDLVTTVHLVSSELAARGFGEQVLVALFRFKGGERPVYLVYGYKTRHVLAVHPDRRGPAARQRGGAPPEERAREGAPDGAAARALARALRRPARLSRAAGLDSLGRCTIRGRTRRRSSARAVTRAAARTATTVT